MSNEAIAALAKAQSEMGKALKNANNPHLKSKYADLGAVMDACFSALHGNGFAVMQPGGADNHGQFVETVFAHSSGHEFRSKCYLLIGKQDMQGVGSAWTYARRYGLMGMAGLAPEDDDGEGTKRPTRQERKSEPERDASEAQSTFNHRERADEILGWVSGCKTQQHLRDVWTGNSATINRIKADKPPMFAELEAAKNKAKASLPDGKARQAPQLETAGPDVGDGWKS